MCTQCVPHTIESKQVRADHRATQTFQVNCKMKLIFFVTQRCHGTSESRSKNCKQIVCTFQTEIFNRLWQSLARFQVKKIELNCFVLHERSCADKCASLLQISCSYEQENPYGFSFLKYFTNVQYYHVWCTLLKSYTNCTMYESTGKVEHMVCCTPRAPC